MRKLFVLIAAVAFVAAFTAPAFAAEWSFYGSARITTFWGANSDERAPTGDDDTDLNHTLQGNSRIGANVKAGEITGQFEYGTGVNTRIIWGEYDFGGWQLGLGQTYSPVNFFASNQVFGSDNDMLNYGGVYGGRNPMVRAKFGGFQVALLQPGKNTGGLEGDLRDLAVDEGLEVGNVDTDVIFPKIEARYNMSMGGFLVEVGGGWNTLDAVAEVEGDEEEETIDSYIVYLGGKYNAGPFYFGGDVFWGKNIGNYGMLVEGNAFATLDEDGDVEDCDSWGFLAVVGFTMNDMIRFEGGYGQAEHDANFESEDEVVSYYVQATINIAKGFFIVPEIGYVDFKDGPDGEDQGDTTYYGLKWQINF